MSDLVTTLDHGAVRELRLSRPPVNALDPARPVRLHGVGK